MDAGAVHERARSASEILYVQRSLLENKSGMFARYKFTTQANGTMIITTDDVGALAQQVLIQQCAIRQADEDSDRRGSHGGMAERGGFEPPIEC